MMVDAATRLDATAALPGKKFMYKYTLVDSSMIGKAAEIETAMRPMLINNYKTADQMKDFREHGVTLVYSYFDEQGNQLTSFEISPNDF